MMEKSEPPVAPDGYMLAMAYVSLLDVIRVMTTFSEGNIDI